MNISIAICDDEKAQTDFLELMVKKWAKAGNHNVTVDIFHSAESFLFHYEQTAGYLAAGYSNERTKRSRACKAYTQGK